jgi:hypothetical protein
MARTCTETLFFRLTLRMGSKEQQVVDGRELRCLGKKGKKLVPIASGRVEPLFVWRPKPTVEWLTPRTELIRQVPTPASTEEASELAFATARQIDAIAVTSDADWDRKTFKTHSVTYYAVTSFEFVGTESGESRDKACMQLVWRLLRDTSSVLIDEFTRYGSAGARQYAYRVGDLQAVVAATATHYVHGAAVHDRLVELATKLDTWSVRAAIPTDEPLRVAAEIGAEVGGWKAMTAR